MAFVLVSTLSAMSVNLTEFWRAGEWTLFVTGLVILALALWLTVEAAVAVRQYRRAPVVEDMDVRFRAATIDRSSTSKEET